MSSFLRNCWSQLLVTTLPISNLDWHSIRFISVHLECNHAASFWADKLLLWALVKRRLECHNGRVRLLLTTSTSVKKIELDGIKYDGRKICPIIFEAIFFSLPKHCLCVVWNVKHMLWACEIFHVMCRMPFYFQVTPFFLQALIHRWDETVSLFTITRFTIQRILISSLPLRLGLHRVNNWTGIKTVGINRCQTRNQQQTFASTPLSFISRHPDNENHQ